MSIEQRKMIGEIVKYVVYVSIGISGWLIKEDFLEMRKDLHEMKSDITNVKERVIRLETKIEDRK